MRHGEGFEFFLKKVLQVGEFSAPRGERFGSMRRL
jgi:hypothetical protein